MADEKDRRSRMSTSSLHAPAKKGGAGGHFTWGAAADVHDFEPVGPATQGAKVTTATAPESDKIEPCLSPHSLGLELGNETQFPALPSGAPKHLLTNGAWTQRQGSAAAPGPPLAVVRRGGGGGPADLLAAYDAELRLRPLRTKLLTAAVINAASELLSYRFAGVAGGGPAILRQCAIGVGLTAIVHRWYAGLERAFAAWPPGAAGTVAAKTALQMLLLEPVLAATYLAAKKLLSGQRDVVAGLRGSVAKVTMASWSVWGPTAVMQYRFVPLAYRNLVGNVVNLFYTIYLIATTSGTRVQPS